MIRLGTTFPTKPVGGELFFHLEHQILYCYTMNFWMVVSKLMPLSPIDIGY